MQNDVVPAGPAGAPPRQRAAAAFAAVLAMALLSACGGSDRLPAASAETPVIVISIDTLRSDRLPAYGYGAIETPNIDSFRREAVLFEHAYSHYPLTLPSHASILTGLLPADHGVRDNTGFQIRSDVKTVGEMLAANGYATGAAVSSFILRRETGIDRGFQSYDDAVAPLSVSNRQIGTIQRDGSETAKVALEWIGRQQKPVFFMLHLYEPHTPYSPPEPYRSRYSDPYDGEVARVDEIVGGFVAGLKEKGLWDRALVILLSDHGEGLNDHGEDEHGMFLYREAIQVPLMVKFPGAKLKGKTVSVPVQLIDVVPTILERTGITPASPLPGRSLASIAADPKPERRKVYSETWYARFHYGWSEQHSLVDGERHYIHSPKAELYDLTKDFAEKTNVLESDRRTYFAMKQAIEPLIRDAAAPAPADREEVAKLAALGYLGSTVQTRPGEVLPDPKDHVDDVRRVTAAFAKYHQRQYAEALAMLEGLLAENSRILDLYDLKSKALARLGRRAEAVAAAKEGLRLAPNATHMALDVAMLQLELGNLDDAEKHAELGVKTNPAQAHDFLSRVWIARKDLARAEAEARKSMESDGDRVSPLMTLARVKLEQGKLEEAARLLDDAVGRKKEGQEVAMLYYLRGDVMARLGRAEEAERDFRREIELFPEDPLAYKNLVLLLVAGQRIPEATQLIRTLIAESPLPASYLAVCQVLETVGDRNGVRYWARQGLSRYPADAALRKLAG